MFKKLHKLSCNEGCGFEVVSHSKDELINVLLDHERMAHHRIIAVQQLEDAIVSA